MKNKAHRFCRALERVANEQECIFETKYYGSCVMYHDCSKSKNYIYRLLDKVETRDEKIVKWGKGFEGYGH